MNNYFAKRFVFATLLSSLGACASFSPPASLKLKSFHEKKELEISYLKSFKTVESAELGSREMLRPELANSWQWRRRNAVGSPQQSWISPQFIGGDDVLLCTVGGGISVVDLKSGAARWKVEIPVGVASQPFLLGSFVFVAGLDGWVRKLRMDTGHQEWASRISSESTGGVTVNGGKVFVSSADDSLWALDEKTGKSMWSYRRPSPQGNVYWSLKGASVPHMSPDGSVIYSGFSDGYFVALESSSGNTVWERNFDRAGRFKDADQPFVLSQDGTLIYLPLVDGDLLVLKSKDGSSQWSVSGAGASVPLLDENEGALYTSNSDGSLLKVDLKSAKIIWATSSMKAFHTQAQAVSSRFVSYLNSEKGLQFVDRKTGEIVSEVYLGRTHIAPPAFDGARLVVLSSRNHVIVYKVTDRQI